MAKRPQTDIDLVVNELVAIKRLIVFQLMQSGVSQKEVANALGIDQSNVSRMFANQFGKGRSGRNG